MYCGVPENICSLRTSGKQILDDDFRRFHFNKDKVARQKAVRNRTR